MPRFLLPLMLPLLLAACADPPPPVDHTARRAALHTELKQTLGADWEAGADQFLTGARTDRGEQIYNKSCGNCHGTDLRGRGPRSGGMDPPPQPLVGPDRAPLPPAALVHLISKGSPGTAMAPWGRAFDEAQIRDVVAFIWAKKAAAELE